MKKIIAIAFILGLVSPLIMFAQTDTTVLPPVVTATPTVVYDGICASNAIVAHENSLQTIVEERQISMKTAVTARRDALGAAYLLTDKTTRDTAIITAQNAFLTAQNAADKTAMDASSILNESFKIKMQACGAALPPTVDQINNQNQPNNNQLKNFSRTLIQGMRGEDVKKVQQVLGLKEDGVFGSMTVNKVKEWQLQKGLTQDGILGKQSLGEMETEIESENSGSNNDANQGGDNNQGNTNVNNSDSTTKNTSGDN